MTEIVQKISSNLKIKKNNILKPLEGHFKVNYCKFFKNTLVHGLVTMHPPPPHILLTPTNFN